MIEITINQILMARPTSFNKKEVEKKKGLKRKEKQQRKDERKASGVRSFDEMIAYVDENGRLANAPPDPNKKQKVTLDSIIVSPPKKEAMETEPLTGRVEHFNSDKGFGFIKDTNSTDKYFFHISNAQAGIAERDMVTFELEQGQKGMNAVKIVLVK
jgi:cold shock CspA family protein